MAEEKKKKGMNKNIKKFVAILSISAAIVVFVLVPYYANWKWFPVRQIMVSLEENAISWRFQAKALTSGNTVTLIETKETNYITNIDGTVSVHPYVKKTPISSVKLRDGIYNKLFIVGIDEAALDVYGRWPIDRVHYTNITDHFNSFPFERMPALLMFDIVFAVPSNPHSDEVFINSLKNYRGNLGEDFILDMSRDVQFSESADVSEEAKLAKWKDAYRKDSLNYISKRAQSLKRFELDKDKNFDLSENDLKKMVSFNKVASMLPEIADELTFAGPANTDISTGISVRKKPLVFSVVFYTNTTVMQGGKMVEDIELVKKYYPDIILAMAVKLLDSHISNIVVKRKQIIIKNALVDGKRVDYKIPVDDRYRLSINYKASQTAEYIRVASMKDIKLYQATGLRKGSVFMVGMFAQGAAQDIWASPLGNMYGILHLGYALGTVMNSDFIIDVPEWVNVLYVVILTLLVGYLISRGIKLTVLGSAISIIVPLVLGFVLFQFSINIFMMVPLITGVLSLLSGIVYLLLTEEKEKRFIKSTFSSYVSPDLVDMLVQNPDILAMGGDSKDLTILFSDIRGFTTISEGMTPEHLIKFLNIYFTKMTDIVMDTKGTLDKYIGDAVMAFWGAPIEMEDHALKACQAAILMMKALAEFNDEQTKLGEKAIDIGIGLNSNVVNVGNVGSETRKNYTVIGDGVNLASRLEGANKPYKTHIIISEFTYAKVKDDVLVRELDLMTVKGKKLPVRIYELWDVLKWD